MNQTIIIDKNTKETYNDTNEHEGNEKQSNYERKRKMKKKKLMVLCLAAVMVLSMGGCGKKTDETKKDKSLGGKEKDQPVVGVLYDFMQVERRVKGKEALEKYADEYGFKIIFQDANGDEELQLQQCENLITQGVDALVILSQNADAAAPMVEQAQAEGIKVIATDRVIKNAKPEAFVGINNETIGDLMAQYVFEKQPSGNYALVSGAPTDPNCQTYKDGWMRVIGDAVKSGDIHIISDTACENWDPAIAVKDAENFLTANNDEVDVVLAMNDGTGAGVVEALKARGLDGKVLVTGQDGELAACQRIAEGSQSVTLWKPDDKISELLAKTVSELLDGTFKSDQTVSNGKDDIPAVLFDAIVVDKDNLMDTVIKSNYHKMEDVYANVPKDQWPEK